MHPERCSAQFLVLGTAIHAPPRPRTQYPPFRWSRTKPCAPEHVANDPRPPGTISPKTPPFKKPRPIYVQSPPPISLQQWLQHPVQQQLQPHPEAAGSHPGEQTGSSTGAVYAPASRKHPSRSAYFLLPTHHPEG